MLRWYTALMPTTRPRHQITETDELSAALDRAALRWPDLSRGQLITRLALNGARFGHETERAEQRRRRDLLAKAGREFAGIDARVELERMRAEDWPA